MAQNKYLQLLRNSDFAANYDAAVALIEANAPKLDGAPIIVRFTEEGKTHALLGVSYNESGAVHFVELGGERIKDVKEALEAAIEAAKKAATTKVVNALDDAHIEVTASEADANGAITYTVKGNDIASASATSESLNSLDEKIDGVSEIIGDGFTKDATVAAAIEDLQTKVGDKSVDEKIADLDAEVSGNSTHITVKVTEVDGKLTAVEVSEKDLVDVTDFNDLKETVDTFFADANVTSDAIDTLKELQEYITSDKSGAFEMQQAIADNKQNIETVSGDVATLTQTVADNKAEAEQALTEAIAALDAEVSGASTHVTVEVSEVDGKLTAVAVTESDIASAAALAEVKADVDVVKADYLKGADKTELEGAIADAQSAAVASAKEYTDAEIAKLDLTVEAEEVSVADSANVFTGATVEAVLKELNDKIASVASDALGIEAGNGIVLTQNNESGNTVIGVQIAEHVEGEDANDLLTATANGLSLSNVWDCGTF